MHYKIVWGAPFDMGGGALEVSNSEAKKKPSSLWGVEEKNLPFPTPCSPLPPQKKKVHPWTNVAVERTQVTKERKQEERCGLCEF